MDKDLIERQRAEAQRRLEILTKKGLLPIVLKEFKEDGTIYYSDYGILYRLKEGNNCDNLVEAVKEFEEKYNALVYTAVLSRLDYGDHLSLLYISEHASEWERDITAVKENMPCVYVKNISDPILSEFGYIQITTYMGGLVRTA